jgi:glycerophosphoryl diester phosphodiesterase
MKKLRSIFGIFLCIIAVSIGSMPAAHAVELACPTVISHKGNTYSGAPSENSMGAFTNAFNIGSQWVETDVHFTSDSVPVLMHNPTVDDATDGTGAIASMTGAQFTALHLADGQHPPTLDQLMTLITADPSHHLLLEMKATSISTAQEEILLSKLQGHEDQVHIYAFSNRYPTVQHLKAADPAFTTSILGYDPILPPPAGIASEDLEYTYLTQARVDQLHSLGLKVKAWTPDNATAWTNMRNMGVDTIITNKTRDYLTWAKATCPAPTVSITGPTAGSTVSGTTQVVTADATDAAAVSSVQFQLDGVNLGTPDTAAPYAANWDTTTATNGTHTLRAIATNSSSWQTTSSSVNVTVNNTSSSSPTVSVTAPAANSTVSSTQTVTADASDDSAVTSVQFQLDGANLGTADTTAPYSTDWNTTTATNGTHALTAIVTDDSSLQTTSSTVNVTVNNTVTSTPPTVSMTGPTGGSNVSGTSQAVTASASDTIAVSSVQFQLDGVNLGTADTTAPYSVNWNTVAAANGVHSLRAIATNSGSLQTTSSGVNVTVSNPTTTEYVTNPSVETDMTGWNALWSTNSVNTRVSGGYDGTYAVRSVNNSSATAAHGFSGNPKILDGTANATVAGKIYTGTVWVKPDYIGQKINLYLREQDAANATVSSRTVTVTAANTNWVNLTNAYTAAATGNKLNVSVWANSTANQGFLSDLFSLTTSTTPAPTAPTVSVTAPTVGSTVSGTQTVTATASDAIAVTSVQFQLDGVDLGAADTTAPYTANWDTTTATEGTHTLRAIATNTSSLQTTSANVSVTVHNPTAPTVSVTAPTASSTVSGTQTVTADASDAVSVTSVQFQLDGVNLGTADTTAPYTVDWDTTTSNNGVHTLRAIATNTSSLQTTSSEVSVTVSNVTPPTVSLTAPTEGTVSGTQAVTAHASDDIAVSSVQFQLDGANLGTADTTAPYSVDWDTTTATNGTHTLRAIATNSSSLQTTSSEVSVTVNNVIPTPPSVSMTGPAAGTVSGTQAVSADASDDVAVSSVQFQLDGVNLGSADTTAPYTIDWDTTTATNGTHVLRAIATNSSSLQATSSEVTVTVNNPTPPTVSITGPAAGTVSGTLTVSANASDDVAVTSVQFQLDGVNLGTADTSAPYSISWNTTTATNGTHTLRAIATNSSSLQTTSSDVTVTVNNPTFTEFVTNASVETDMTAWSGSWSTNSVNTRVTGGYDGTYAVRSVNNGAANVAHGFSGNPKVLDGVANATVAGKVYTGSVWVKPDYVGQKINLYLREQDGANATVSSKTVVMTATTTNWIKITNAYTAVATGNKLNISVWCGNSATNQGFLADLFSLTSPN